MSSPAARHPLDRIDPAHEPSDSIVLRYRDAFPLEEDAAKDEAIKEWLPRTSAGEGVRVFPLLEDRGVRVHILDETSLMHTRTMRSVDGCVDTARCKAAGLDRTALVSGGNTGTAATEYGRRAGIETFLLLPEENVGLLDSRFFAAETSHLVAVEQPGFVKQAGALFREITGIPGVPGPGWRYGAARFRGMFLLELLEREPFQWLSQTISAAFGPIGIYSVLGRHLPGDRVPRFLGVQQAANCPMYRAWKGNGHAEEVPLRSTSPLLARVLYDHAPFTYGTWDDLSGLLRERGGALTTIDEDEFRVLLERQFDGRNVVELLENNGIPVPRRNGEVVDKIGLISLAGTLKEIARGTIPAGATALCCLTGAASDPDGRARPEFRITAASWEADVAEYGRRIAGRADVPGSG